MKSGCDYLGSDSDYFRENGFAPFGYDPFARSLVEAGANYANTVFVRDRVAVESRIGSAPTFRLVNGQI